jgi:ABC-type dipeptide/oligopeptide/nickel transport system ATPase subunit
MKAAPYAASNMPSEPLLRVTGLSKTLAGRQILHDVCFTLDRARTLAITGASGSGKTTLARCLARFELPDSGQILLEGHDLRTLPRSAVQLILQQPGASLNPRFTAAGIVSEPLVIQNCVTPKNRRQAIEARVRTAMESVGLDPAAAGRRATAFSGGERRRLAIARALTVEPKVLILDESLASLDLSIQAQIVNLLLELQERRGLAYVLVSHDLAGVARIADEIAVMEGGAIVEHAATAELLAGPRHPAARALVEANRALSAGQ